MSPNAEAYLTGASSVIRNHLIYIPRQREYLTQKIWDRMTKALSKPIDTSKIVLEARRG